MWRMQAVMYLKSAVCLAALLSFATCDMCPWIWTLAEVYDGKSHKVEYLKLCKRILVLLYPKKRLRFVGECPFKNREKLVNSEAN